MQQPLAPLVAADREVGIGMHHRHRQHLLEEGEGCGNVADQNVHPEAGERAAEDVGWHEGGRHERLLGAVVHKRFLARSEEHTSELQSLMRISSAVFCLKKKKK